MISRIFLYSLFAVFAFAVVAPVYAEEEAQRDEQFMSIHDRIKALTKDFDELSERHFYALYGSHNMIKVVEDVRMQVGDAVEKCVDVNPDMKEALESRYKDWDAALEPIMDDAEANVDNMIAAQDYTKPRDIRKLLKFVDETREGKNKDLEKFPITTPEACEYLRVKMDETQENLTKLLESTLVSLPQSMVSDIEEDKAAQEEAVRKAEEEAKAKAEEEARKAEEAAEAESQEESEEEPEE